jgi:hypothetical protein
MMTMMLTPMNVCSAASWTLKLNTIRWSSFAACPQPIRGVVETKSTNLLTMDQHNDTDAHERLQRRGVYHKAHLDPMV